MKLEIKKGSENYTCQVITLPPKVKVEGLDKLTKITYQGNDVLTQKDADENQLYLFFPAGAVISQNYLHFNDEFRDPKLNYHQDGKGGFFEPTARVKAIKFKGVISSGYLAPVYTLEKIADYTKLKAGDEFNVIDGVTLCEKYKIVYTKSTSTKESRYNKKLKRFDKLVVNQFRFHVDTSHLAKNLHMFHSEDIIVLTDKWHGTSAVFSNLLVNKELKWYEKLAVKLGIDVVTTKYDNLYSSRSVIKNQYINKDATSGFYNEDIWGVVNKEVKDKIESGISLYGEIVGFLPSGGHIQRGYDYGCKEKEHKFLIYRITYTKPDGNVIEFSWQQIKNYCQKYQLEHVKELYFGKAKDHTWNGDWDDVINIEEPWREMLFNDLSHSWNLEKDCKWCINRVPAEGICVRRDGLETYSAYKLKSKNFILRESNDFDKNIDNIEDVS